METQIISLMLKNFYTFEDEQLILEYFDKIKYADKVTANAVDQMFVASGDNISREELTMLLSGIGFVVA